MFRVPTGCGKPLKMTVKRGKAWNLWFFIKNPVKYLKLRKWVGFRYLTFNVGYGWKKIHFWYNEPQLSLQILFNLKISWNFTTKILIILEFCRSVEVETWRVGEISLFRKSTWLERVDLFAPWINWQQCLNVWVPRVSAYKE